MSIEVSSAPQGAKPVSNADSQGKKAGKAGEGASGFAAMMNSLAATQPSDGEVAADTSLVGQDDANGDTAASEADGVALAAQSAVVTPLNPELAFAMLSPAVPQGLASGLSEGALGAMQALNATGGAVLSEDLSATAKGVGLKPTDAAKTLWRGAEKTTGDTLSKGVFSPADAGLGASAKVSQAASDDAATTPVNALLAHRSLVQSQTASAAQSDLKEAKTAATQSAVTATDTAAPWLVAGMADALVQPQGRSGHKSGQGQSGSSGFEGVFGQAMANAGALHPDAVFEVPPASATVADTAIAETVSYWASHGVQTAELTLDGFGDKPVEVSILLNGDQAQINFRTDQTDVRQLLEGAAAHLKELLSNEGLQLAGVSVGSSGQGSAGEDRRQRPGAQQITFAKVETLNPAAARAANPAVGRSLDLFV